MRFFLGGDLFPCLDLLHPNAYYKSLRPDQIIAPDLLGDIPEIPNTVVPNVVKFKGTLKYVLYCRSLHSAISFKKLAESGEDPIVCLVQEVLMDAESYDSFVETKIGMLDEPRIYPTISSILKEETYPPFDLMLPSTEAKPEPETLETKRVVGSDFATLRNRKGFLGLMEKAKAKRSNVETYVKSQLQMPAMEAIPFLIGHTGIAKSAIIYQVASDLDSAKGNEWGYRTHTIKVGFLERLDFLGYTNIRDVPGIGKISEYAPMQAMALSEDRFVDSCRAAVKKFKTPPKDPKERTAYEKLLYYAKTPVLFFDELNRTQDSIFNLLVTLFNDRKIEEFTYKNAKIIAAANIVADPTSGEVIESELYKTGHLHDLAVISRARPVNVTPEDMEPSFRNAYKSKKWTIAPELDKLDISKLHDVREALIEKPNLTFRSWEFLEKYVNWLLKTKTDPYHPILEGIGCSYINEGTGEVINDAIKNLLENLGIKGMLYSSDVDDPMQTFIDHCYGSGLPTMLLGRFGIGKTARIAETAKREGAETLHLTLAGMDRCLIYGTPAPIDVGDAIFGEALRDTEVASTLRGEITKHTDIPLKTTKYHPNGEAVDKVRKCQKEGKKLVITFDEFNRADHVVQAAVFGAISDNELYGVKLDPENVRFVCAGNVSTEDVQHDVEELDAATCARFTLFRKDEITSKDVEIFRKYASENFCPQVVTAIENTSDDIMMVLMSELQEEPQLGQSITCTRSFKSVSDMIERDAMLRGITPNVKTLKTSPDSVNEMCFNSDMEFDCEGISYDIKDIPELWKNRPEMHDCILKSIPDIQENVQSYRSLVFSSLFSNTIDSQGFVDVLAKALDQKAAYDFISRYEEIRSMDPNKDHFQILAESARWALGKNLIKNGMEFVSGLTQIMSTYSLSWGGFNLRNLTKVLEYLQKESNLLDKISVDDPNELKNFLKGLM